MSIQSEINRINNNVQNTLNAIAETGVTVGAGSNALPAAAAALANEKADVVHSHLYYGVCSTAADTAAKTVTVDGFKLVTGAMVIVKFTYANSVASPTLNVSSTGAKPIYRYGTTAASTGTTTNGWVAGAVQTFVYDGTGWIREYWYNTTYSNVALGQGYATCSTAAATTAKVGTLSSYALTTGGVVAVKFTYAVPASATLNINSKGAKAIYYRGAAITANVIKAGDIATFIYNGSQYHLLAIDRWQADISTAQSTADSAATAASNAATAAANAQSRADEAYNAIPVVYTAAQCTSFTSDEGTCTPAAVKKAAITFALPQTGGTVTGNITLDNSASSQSGEPQLKWGTYSSNTPFIGFATDQSDGTFVLCSLKGTTYATGLAIGGGSGNLLWKGVKVATTSDIPSVSGYAPKASPAFTGTPTAPTAAAGTNTTQIATTAFVQAALAGIDTGGGGSTVITGTYTGDYAATRTINIGATPKFVFITIPQYTSGMGPWIKMAGMTMVFSQGTSSGATGRVNTAYGIVDGGFTVGNSDTYNNSANQYGGSNSAQLTYHYVAIC